MDRTCTCATFMFMFICTTPGVIFADSINYAMNWILGIKTFCLQYKRVVICLSFFPPTLNREVTEWDKVEESKSSTSEPRAAMGYIYLTALDYTAIES